MFQHSVWSVITAHKLTAVKRDVNTVVSDQPSRFTAPSIGDYNTPDTGETCCHYGVIKHDDDGAESRS